MRRPNWRLVASPRRSWRLLVFLAALALAVSAAVVGHGWRQPGEDWVSSFSAAPGLGFVAPPRRGPSSAGIAQPSEAYASGVAASPEPRRDSAAVATAAAAVLLVSLAGVGASKRGLLARRAAPGVDWSGNRTGWSDIKPKSLFEVDWLNIHGILSISAILLFLFQGVRIASHQAPSLPEVWVTTAIYLPWTYFCWRDTKQLESHYQVTFYASCGWGIMSLASLHSVVWQDKFPELAFDVLSVGNVVFLASCIYFYGYHWSRMWRHFTQNRFRPLWIPGLLGLMLLHSLTVLDFAKRVDDMAWWKTVCTIYPDEWWWVADVRLIELFVTAAALWLIILHIQGVFTGMKNAAAVVIGTIFLPLGIMVGESTWLKASAWQHYLMNGPKYW